jgi:hypothetical protein
MYKLPPAVVLQPDLSQLFRHHSAEQTVFVVGPGVKVMAAILSLLRCSVSNQASTNQGSS